MAWMACSDRIEAALERVAQPRGWTARRLKPAARGLVDAREWVDARGLVDGWCNGWYCAAEATVRIRSRLMAGAETHITVSQMNGVEVVEFVDRKILDELSITELGDQLRTLAESAPSIRLLLNFRNVEHLSSAALGMLITLDKLVKDNSGTLKLCNINQQIYELFNITRLNMLFAIHGTTEESLANF